MRRKVIIELEIEGEDEKHLKEMPALIGFHISKTFKGIEVVQIDSYKIEEE